MKKNMSWKFTDESSETFQSSVSGPGEFGLKSKDACLTMRVNFFLKLTLHYIRYVHTKKVKRRKGFSDSSWPKLSGTKPTRMEYFINHILVHFTFILRITSRSQISFPACGIVMDWLCYARVLFSILKLEGWLLKIFFWKFPKLSSPI